MPANTYIPIKSVITCPQCGYKKEEEIQEETCLHFYECEHCKTVLKPKPGDCCVFCSYGSVKCRSKQKTSSGMNALVISGGGSAGAFAGGVAEFLLMKEQKKYDLYVGTSAGSLLIPLLSIGKIDKLKSIFTSISQDDIFDFCPFVIKKENGISKSNINYLGNVWMFLRGKKTFGESRKLRTLIRETISKDDFEEMKIAKADVIITVSNLTTNSVEYKSVKNCTYHDFCDWIWASANVVPFMSLLRKNGSEYADGGIGNFVPVSHAIGKGAIDIDVIALRTEKQTDKYPPAGNALELILRVFSFMLNQIGANDIAISRLEGLQKDVNLRFYFSPKKLSANPLIFDKEQMKRWWKYGFIHTATHAPVCHCIKGADSKQTGTSEQINIQQADYKMNN